MMSDTTKTTWIAKSVNGTLDWGSDFNVVRLRSWLERNPNKVLKLTPVKEYRSGQQNNYYWLYLDIISNETGNDPIELHEFFKRKLLPRKKVSIKGKKKDHEFERETSTTELSKIDFGEYLDKICQITEVPLPDPKEAGYIVDY